MVEHPSDKGKAEGSIPSARTRIELNGFERLLSNFGTVRANHSAFAQSAPTALPATSFRKVVLLFQHDIFLAQSLVPTMKNSHQNLLYA